MLGRESTLFVRPRSMALSQPGSNHRELDMRHGLPVLATLVVTLFASASGAIDAPPGATDLQAGVEPLAKQFDVEKGQHRLLVLLSPA